MAFKKYSFSKFSWVIFLIEQFFAYVVHQQVGKLHVDFVRKILDFLVVMKVDGFSFIILWITNNKIGVVDGCFLTHDANVVVLVRILELFALNLNHAKLFKTTTFGNFFRSCFNSIEEKFFIDAIIMR